MSAFHRAQPLLALAVLALSSLPCRALQLEDELSEAGTDAAEASAPAQPAPDTERALIADYLRANIGEPYTYGAQGGEQGFDCSGLVQQAYASAGVEVPRVSRAQLDAGVPVPIEALKTGDLLFYRLGARRHRLHVAVYVGEGRAIHASVKHGEVREIDIRHGPWPKTLVAARTLL